MKNDPNTHIPPPAADEAEEAAARREAMELREALRRGELSPPDSLSPEKMVALLEQEAAAEKRRSRHSRKRWALPLTACAAGLLLLLPAVPRFFSPHQDSSLTGGTDNTVGSRSDVVMGENLASSGDRAPQVPVSSPDSMDGIGEESPLPDNSLPAQPEESSKDLTSAGRVQAIAAPQVEGLLREGSLLVDVREPEEFTAGHIPQAVNLPMDNLTADIITLADTGRPLIVYCRTGVRSRTAAEELAALGYTVYDLGGIATDWPYATQTGS